MQRESGIEFPIILKQSQGFAPSANTLFYNGYVVLTDLQLIVICNARNPCSHPTVNCETGGKSTTCLLHAVYDELCFLYVLSHFFTSGSKYWAFLLGTPGIMMTDV